MIHFKSWTKLTHSVPLFQGEQSRRHIDRPVWKLGIEGGINAITNFRQFGKIQHFVQFLGFPRSGHSLIGSLLDAHPEAIISHELDTMGLIKKGLPERVIYGLIKKNSEQFTQNGRYWNGFSYVVPNQPHGRSGELHVIGDKKGDWAVRWCDQNPKLLSDFQKNIKSSAKWILVTRNPLDNIATMSLRKNRTYDKLRIHSESKEVFKSELKKLQVSGEISETARDDMITDYENLCRMISKMRRIITKKNFIHVVYEDFCSDPKTELSRICSFLNIESGKKYLEDCASIVKTSLNKSRNRISWSPEQLAQVNSIVEEYSFLQCYTSDLELHV